MPESKGNEIAARKAALDILNALDRGHDLLDKVMEDFAGDRMSALSPEDRRLANAIVFGVLRWRRRLDWIIRQHAAMPLDKISPEIRNILRIALFQMLFLDRVPDFAAVDTSVEIAKRFVSIKSSRFVNGLLRNTLRKLPSDINAILPDDAVAALAVSSSFPDWLIHRWVSRHGIDETARLCEAMNQIPPLTIRTNTLKIDRQSLMAMLYEVCEDVYKTEYTPDGLSFYSPVKPIDQLAPFKNGLFQVQDEAAQVASYLLLPEPNETILDACAGLGGKTGHIAQLMENSGKIFAVDKDEEKLTRLTNEMNRLGISIVNTCPINFDQPDWQKLPETFDRILLDAPCSGLGVIRRNPDIKWAAHKKDLKRFAKRQLAYLDELSQRLAPSGILVYAVCTTEPEETDGIIEKFLKLHPEFGMVAGTSGLPGNFRKIVDHNGVFRSLPHMQGMDGFFAVRLKRRS